MNLTFQLPRFEGPLALLLYFIRKEEMNIFDIPINRITAQYLEYLKMMRELDLEVAGEFISMAATLLHIKSRMLLPQYNDQGEVVEEDPRQELVQRLLEYEQFQAAAKELYERPLLGRDYWARGFHETWEAPADDEVIVEDNALFQLIQSFRRAMSLAKKKVHQVAGKIQSISARIQELRSILVLGARQSLSEIITKTGEERRQQVLITFLTLLELGKIGIVRLFQADPHQDIWIETCKPIEGDAISKVEEYNALPEIFATAFDLPPSAVTTPNVLAAEDLEILDQAVVQTSSGGLSGDSGSDSSGGALSAGVSLGLSELSPDFLPEEIASDEEILAAEQELAGKDFQREGDSVAQQDVGDWDVPHLFPEGEPAV